MPQCRSTADLTSGAAAATLSQPRRPPLDPIGRNTRQFLRGAGEVSTRVNGQTTRMSSRDQCVRLNDQWSMVGAMRKTVASSSIGCEEGMPLWQVSQLKQCGGAHMLHIEGPQARQCKLHEGDGCVPGTTTGARPVSSGETDALLRSLKRHQCNRGNTPPTQTVLHDMSNPYVPSVERSTRDAGAVWRAVLGKRQRASSSNGRLAVYKAAGDICVHQRGMSRYHRPVDS
eukprot:scaffold269807_cov35-Tisochrysis_lutea.AAC.2